MNATELKTELELPAYAGRTDEQIITALNAPVIEYSVEPSKETAIALKILGALVKKGTLLQKEADAVVSRVKRTRSRYEELSGAGAVATPIDLSRARLVDKAAQIQALIDANAQRGAVLAAMLADVESGSDVNLEALK